MNAVRSRYSSSDEQMQSFAANPPQGICLNPHVWLSSKVLKINPYFADAHNNLGIALFQKRRFSKATGEFEQAIRPDPANANARNSLATVEAMIRRTPGAAN